MVTQESGIDETAAQKFPGGSVTAGSAASGAGNNRDMPEGGINPNTGKYVFMPLPTPTIPPTYPRREGQS